MSKSHLFPKLRTQEDYENLGFLMKLKLWVSRKVISWLHNQLKGLNR